MIELRLLGTADLRAADDRQPQPAFAQAVLAQPKRLALLAYLAAAAPAGFRRRDTLLALLWPELDDERARNALNKTVHHLRRALGGDTILNRGDDEVGVDPAGLGCDVAAFERALDEGRLADALALYRGDLLDGFFVADAAGFERWLDDRRAALRRRAAEGARALARESEAAGRLDDLRRFAERATTLAGADEGVLREQIALLDRAGDRAGALHAYEVFARRLTADYGSAPSPETQTLVQRLRDQRAPIATPAATPAATPIAALGATPDGMPGARSGARRRWLVACGVVVAAIAVWGVLLARGGRTAVSPASIAVLPFLDLSPDSSRRYLADGMTEQLIDALAQTGALRVAARTAAFRFRGAARVDSIGRELRVANVVEGSVRVAGDRIRVTAQLIDAVSGYHRWSRSYDRALGDVLDVQEDIGRAIVSALAGELATAGRRGRAERPTRDAEAYDLYLRGRHLWRRRSEPALVAAIADFERAIARDSSFALAWVGLADAYAVLPGSSAVPSTEMLPRARAALARALELDSTLVDAHVSLAGLMASDWDWPGATRHLARAVTLAPGNGTAHQWYGESLIVLGRTDEAIAEMRRALLLDPGSAIVGSELGWFLLTAHRYADAVTQFRQTIAVDSGFSHAYEGLGSTYREIGRLDDAVAAMRRATALSGSSGSGARARGYLGHALALAGHRQAARRVLDSLRSPADGIAASAWAIAAVHTGLGDRDSALVWLDLAYQARDPGMAYVGIDPIFATLRADRRFVALLGRMGLARTPGA
jgi:TolB-like protein/DNA-binding SARP family transcriptional activator/Tfp pilus assembly protein PilF